MTNETIIFTAIICAIASLLVITSSPFPDGRSFGDSTLGQLLGLAALIAAIGYAQAHYDFISLLFK